MSAPGSRDLNALGYHDVAYHEHLMAQPVINQRDLAIRRIAPIHGYPRPRTVGATHGDRVNRTPMAILDRILLPVVRHAWRNAERVAVLREAEDGLESHTIHPARRT